MDVSLFMARVAEQGDRYEDMFIFLKEAFQRRTSGHYTVDERNLMSVAFKNLVTPRRTTWRTILAVEQSGASSG
jgi:14-3-3 protein epsilon